MNTNFDLHAKLPCFHELLCDNDDTLYFVSGDGYVARTHDVLERLSHILQNDNGADILRQLSVWWSDTMKGLKVSRLVTAAKIATVIILKPLQVTMTILALLWKPTTKVKK